MNLDKRIRQIEQHQNVKSLIFRVARFVIDMDVQIIGYECDGVTIRREPNESLQALHSRAVNTVSWPPYTVVKAFYPL